MRYLILLILFIMVSVPVSADEKEKPERPSVRLPDYMQLQFAGGKGLVSAWAGYQLGKNKKFDLAIGYGFAPASLTHRDVHKLLLQLNYTFYAWSTNRLGVFHTFAGLGGSVMLNRNDMIFVRLPEQFPSGYYAPNAIRAHVDLGLGHKTRVESTFLQSVDVYFTLTTNDVYLVDYFTSKEFGLGEGISLGMGVRFCFY